MYCVGLTGGIASGKSTVAATFEALGVPVIDADQVARDVVEPGTPGLDDVVSAFGTGILDGGGRLNRRALREIVFANTERRRELEALLHPRIGDRLQAWRDSTEGDYGIMVVPILLEVPRFAALVDRVLVIDTPEQTQIERLMARDGIDRGLAENMLAAQMPRQQRLTHADDVLTNAGTPDDLRQAARALHERYRTLACARAPH